MIFMLSSLALIAEANNFLDDVREEGFKGESISHLVQLRDKMVQAGFNSPFKSLMKITKTEVGELSEDEVADLKKQMGNIRYIASLKKSTLNRVRVAIASHRIHETLLERKEEELLSHLPIDGNYIDTLIKSGETGIRAYSELMDAFSKASSDFPQAMVSVEYTEEGERKKDDIKVYTKENIESRVKRSYGDDAKVTSVKMLGVKKKLIKNRSARVSLLSASVSSAARNAREIMAEGEKQNEKLRAYNNFLRENNLETDIFIDRAEDLEDVKDKAATKGFLLEESGKIYLDPEIEEAVTLRRRKWQAEIRNMAAEKSLSKILKFYMTTSESEREQGNIFPSLAITPTPEQLNVLNMLEFTSLSIQNPSLIVQKKLDAEKLGLRIPSHVFGAAFFSMETGKDVKWCSEFFSISEDDINIGREKLASLLSEGRGKEFIGLMK